MLSSYRDEGLLLEEAYRNYMLFYANRESRDFTDLSRMYWRKELSGLVSLLERSTANPCIVLFGSLSKGEAKADSDVDLAVFGVRKEMDFSGFEKKIGRKVQVLWQPSLSGMKSGELSNSVANGYVLFGRLEV
jgi:predicted nucleotidyltransferase